MNSFSTFSHSSTPILPPYTSLQTYTVLKNRVSIPPLEIPNTNNFSSASSLYSPITALSRPITVNGFPSPNNLSPLKGSLSPVNQELTSLLLTWKIQQNLQAELLKAQMDHIAELKNSLMEKFSQIQTQAEKSALDVQQNKQESQEEPENLVETQKAVRKSPIKNKDLKGQIRDIVHFVLDNFGRINEASFNDEKLNYSHNKDLMQVFDLLTAKYSSTIKTKEEMVKYTLRRAFKFVKNHIKKESNANTKGVSKTLCNKYFNASQDEIMKIGNEEEFLKSVLPFRKNSRNKTMNTSFIGEVFSSENFCKDYEKYLQNFEKILETDNNSKIEKIIEFMEDCIKTNKIQDIKKYKRIPWPKLWIVNTKKIAQDLPTIGMQGNSDSPSKKVKTEENFTNALGDLDCDSEISGDSH